MNRLLTASALVALAVGGGACGDDEQPASEPTEPPVAATDAVQRYPDVIDATAESGPNGWTFSATVSSPYDTPERYADAWRVVADDGTVLGVRELTHDHAAEQPFTRSLASIDVPDSVRVVTIEGRDLEYGWGGETYELSLPRD